MEMKHGILYHVQSRDPRNPKAQFQTEEVWSTKEEANEAIRVLRELDRSVPPKLVWRVHEKRGYVPCDYSGRIV